MFSAVYEVITAVIQHCYKTYKIVKLLVNSYLDQA